MKNHYYITAGRTAICVLLVAVVLTAGIAGAVGTASAEPIDGKGNDPYSSDLYMSLDGKGNDVFTYVFSEEYAGRGGGSGKASL